MNIPRPKTNELLQEGLRRVLADNPSPMTHWGTNTYIVGTGAVAVIDPGPANPRHMQNILNALQPGEIISHIFVTHAHLDHSPLAAILSQETGAPVLAFGDANAGRSQIMNQLAKTGLSAGGEGVDVGFAPDEKLQDGQSVSGKDWEITAHWTPGHMGNHMSFQWDDMVFTGDHIMGWASSLVSPPDGDLTDFMSSTTRLADLNARIFHPGHGAPVTDPSTRANWLIGHRKQRESHILSALKTGHTDIQTLTKSIYTDIAPALMSAAERNVFAHLIDLVQSSRVKTTGLLGVNAKFHLSHGQQ